MTSLQDFRTRWLAWYPDAPPLSHLLRVAYPNRWLRIHSLPDSKRLAETDAEHTEILRRMETAGTDVLGKGALTTLLGYDYAGSNTLPHTHPLYGLLDTTVLLRIAPIDEDSEAISVFGRAVEWGPGRFDELLGAIAADRLRVTWVNLSSGAMFAPFDGGADLFYPATVERDVARTRFASWLPLHPSGL